MSGLVQKVKDKLSNHNERDTSDSYGSSNQAGGQAAGGGGKYGGPVGHSGFENDQSDSDFGAGKQSDQGFSGRGHDSDIGTTHEATTLGRSGGDTYSSGQTGGLAAQGGGQYPGRVGESRGGRDIDSYRSENEAGGLAAQGGGQYPGRVGESKREWE